jgi:Fic family protein
VLTAHLRQARTLLRRVRESEELWGELERIATGKKLPERTIAVLFDAAQDFRVRNSTYRAIWPDEVSEQTASRDLRLLVNEGLLTPVGEKRGRYYIGSDELRETWRRIRAKRTARDEVDPFQAS